MLWFLCANFEEYFLSGITCLMNLKIILYGDDVLRKQLFEVPPFMTHETNAFDWLIEFIKGIRLCFLMFRILGIWLKFWVNSVSDTLYFEF